MAAPELSPEDKDYLIRTVIGEAGNQPPIGQAAVAHVILNRLNAGNYGKSAKDIVLAPSQFEPWSTRGRELRGIPNTAPVYGDIGNIVDKVVAGEIPDPTGGATHFANVKTVQDRGNNKAMGWINGMKNVTRIGDHTFGNADAQPFDFNSVIDSYGAAPASKAQGGFDVNSIIDSYAKPENEVTAAPATPQIGLSSMPVVPDSNLGPNLTAQAPSNDAVSKAVSEFQDRTLNPIRKAIWEGPAIVGGDYIGRLKELADQNAGMVGEGMKDWTQGRAASGAGKVGLGAMGYLFSPAGAIDKPIENMMGNKQFGELATFLVPGMVGSKVVNALRPKVSSLKDIVNDIGPENIPQVINRFEGNPNLTTMDVAPAVRGNAAGLATDPRNAPAMTHLNEFQRARMAERQNSTINAFEDVLGPTPNVKKTVDEIKAQAQKTGKELIEPAIAGAKPVDVTDIVAGLEKRLPSSELKMLKEGKEPPALSEESKRIWSLRQKLQGDIPNGSRVVVEPNVAHEFQMDLRRSSSDPLIGYQARQTRRELVDAIDAAGEPGKYKGALKQYASDKSVDDAFKHGFDMFANPASAEKSIANHPDMWKAWAADASNAELDAVKKGIMTGARSRIVNMRKGIDIPEGSFTHERLAAVVGDKEASKIITTLNDWRAISETDNLLSKNSATAVRQAGQKNREVRDSISGKEVLQNLMPAAVVTGATHLASGSSLLSMLAGGAAIAGGKAANMLGKAHDVATNKAYAQWASATGQKKQDLIDILRHEAARGGSPSNVQKLIDLVPPSLLEALPR